VERICARRSFESALTDRERRRLFAAGELFERVPARPRAVVASDFNDMRRELAQR
jgi:hypothetical protein